MAQFLPLAELRSRQANGPVVEELSKRKALFTALAAAGLKVEPTGQSRYPVRTKLPTVNPRGVNEDVTRDVSITSPQVEEMMIIESPFWIDQFGFYGSPEEAIASEAPAHLEAIAQGFGYQFWYGSRAANPKGLDGLNTRFPLLSSGGQVLSAGGSGTDLTSIWFLEIGEDGVHGFIQSPDDFLRSRFLGSRPMPGGSIEGYMANNAMRMGIVTKRARAACQIANIETSGASNILTDDLLAAAYAKCPGATHVFCNVTGWTQIQKVARGAATIQKDEYGHPFMSFGPVPIYIDDEIVDTEAAKSAS